VNLSCHLSQHKLGRLLAQLLTPLLTPLLALALALAPLHAAHAAVIDVSASTNALNIGQDVFVNFAISGLSGAPGDSLSAFDLDILYDHAVLQLRDFGFADPLSHTNQLALPELGSFAFLGDAIDLGPRIDAFGLSGNSAAVLDADQANAFTFLTLTFRAVGASLATGVAIDTLDPALLFVDSGANTLAATIRAAGVTLVVNPQVVNAPEPASLLLLLVGAAALLAVRPRRAAASAASATSAAARAALLALGLAGALPAGAQTPPAAAPPSQQGQTAPQEQQRLPDHGTPVPAVESIDGVVVAVQGRRAQVRLRSGALRWFSMGAALPAPQVGKRINGVAVARGDAVLLEQPRIAN
jgi:hypothetical protein